MKKRLFISTLCLLTAGVMFINCKGGDGAVGPAGSKGDAGAQGTAGTKGDKGDIGTANVIYSEWLPLPEAFNNAVHRKNFAFSAPKVTQEIVDKGQVYGYLKYSISTYALPVLNKYLTSSGEVSGSFSSAISFSVGSISLNQEWQTAGTIPAAFANGKTVQGDYTNFRYVIVPGGASARVAGLDYTDYEAVKKYYNLPD